MDSGSFRNRRSRLLAGVTATALAISLSATGVVAQDEAKSR